jgi:hypothetical protein
MTASFCDALLQLPGGPVQWRISRGDTVPPSEAVSPSSQFLSFSVELPYFGDSVYIYWRTHYYVISSLFRALFYTPVYHRQEGWGVVVVVTRYFAPYLHVGTYIKVHNAQHPHIHDTRHPLPVRTVQRIFIVTAARCGPPGQLGPLWAVT